ncbi:MAG: ERCC4 domain-containing protein [Candidatus Bathyarchaeia archaeon]
MVKLVVDSREKVGGKVANYFKAKGYEVSVEKLEAGDYWILGAENYAVERKSASDLAKSLVEVRLWDEVKKLKEVENAKPVFIFEHGRLYGKVQLPVVLGALASIALDFEVPVLSSTSLSQTILILERLCVRAIGKGPSRPPTFKPRAETYEEKALRVLSSLPMVSAVRAKKLLERFGTVKNVVNATVEELTQTEGIGEKIAEEIKKVVEFKVERSCLQGS